VVVIVTAHDPNPTRTCLNLDVDISYILETSPIKKVKEMKLKLFVSRVGWISQLVKLVELLVKELEVQGSPRKEKTNITL
jgi:hypothetical protein